MSSGSVLLAHTLATTYGKLPHEIYGLTGPELLFNTWILHRVTKEIYPASGQSGE